MGWIKILVSPQRHQRGAKEVNERLVRSRAAGESIGNPGRHLGESRANVRRELADSAAGVTFNTFRLTILVKEIVIYMYIERKFRIADQQKPLPLFYGRVNPISQIVVARKTSTALCALS